MDTLATQCILSFFSSFLFLFVTWKVYSESRLFSMLGMYRAMCRRVIYHFEDPTHASCTLKTGCTVSAGTVHVEQENVHCLFFLSQHQLCWPQHLLYQHMLLFEHKMCTTGKQHKVCFLHHIYREAETRTSFFKRDDSCSISFLMLLYYYDYYCCFFIIIIIIMTIIGLSLAAATQEQNYVLTLCSLELWFDVPMGCLKTSHKNRAAKS